jgi:hypothetical protein
MMQGTPKTNFDAESINEDKSLFSSEQCLEHNDNNRNEKLDLSLLAEEVIDYIILPLMDTKVFHYLKCKDSKWKRKIEEYVEMSVPMFKFMAMFGSKGSGNGQCTLLSLINKEIFMLVIVIIIEFRYLTAMDNG